MQDARQSLATGKLLAAICLLQVSALFAGAYVARLLPAAGVQAETAASAATLAGQAMLAVLIWPLLLRQQTRPGQFFGKPRHRWRLIGISLGIGLVLRLLDWSWLLYTTELPATVAGGHRMSWRCTPSTVMPVRLLASVVATPLMEEWLHRGVILGILLHRLGWWPAAVLAAAWFAVLHGGGVHPTAMAFGLVAALMVRYDGTLWGPLLAHACFNLLAMVESMCLRVTAPDPATLPRLALLSFGTVALLLAFVLARQTGARARLHPGAGGLCSGVSCRTTVPRAR